MIQAPKPEPRITRYKLTDHEWAAIRPMLPNKPRGVPRVKYSDFTSAFEGTADMAGPAAWLDPGRE
jgi:transposase